MTRKFTGDQILVATHNAGKLQEMTELFAPFGVTVKGAAEMNLGEPEETKTLSSATPASKHVRRWRQRAFPRLQMTPGSRSKRWTMPPASIPPIGPKRPTAAISSWQ